MYVLAALGFFWFEWLRQSYTVRRSKGMKNAFLSGVFYGQAYIIISDIQKCTFYRCAYLGFSPLHWWSIHSNLGHCYGGAHGEDSYRYDASQWARWPISSHQPSKFIAPISNSSQLIQDAHLTISAQDNWFTRQFLVFHAIADSKRAFSQSSCRNLRILQKDVTFYVNIELNSQIHQGEQANFNMGCKDSG